MKRARPARPGATALALMSVPIIPVWARGATEVGQCLRKKNPARPGATEDGECHRVKNPVWARVWARGDREDFRNEAIFIVKRSVKAYFDVAVSPWLRGLTGQTIGDTGGLGKASPGGRE